MKLAERSEEIIETIADMWTEIANNLQIFDEYKDYISEDETLSLALFETHEELLKFAVVTVNVLKLVRARKCNSKCLFQRHGRFRGRLRCVLEDQGKPITNYKSKLDRTSRYISHRIQMIKEMVQAQVLTQDRQSSPRAEMLQYLTQNSFRISKMLTQQR